MTSVFTLVGNGMKSFWQQEDGIGTLEMVLIVAVILIIALAFKNKITQVVTTMLNYMDSQSKEFTE
ncbi:Flp1 family type IVb pilin [Paenibacillus campi]|uniref:Flp1 family type IVb pilin n=1 Tax=Paenibacillus campi TaxID=3106031 RepID=UPI002AFFCD8C|nr:MULTISPECIES: Flp1 family type IVb pilin [unclassified Paenibacillus]